MRTPRQLADDYEARIELIRMDLQLYIWYSSRMMPEEAVGARERARLALEDLAAELR